MADSWNWPALINKIAQDVPFLRRALNALLKQDPTPISDAPVGAKRLYEVSSDKWQWQEYNGSSWAPVPFLRHNVDQLDGYHAAITPAANTVAVRNASGLLEDSITGNAATASSAATLSQLLPVAKGGTGATTSERARINLGVPPTSHVSTATTYGVANASQYGHVKLSDAVDSASGATGGTAATPAAVKAIKDAADAAQSSADAAQSSADAAQSSADAAMTKASTLATASAPGIVQLNNTVTSTSTTQASTANAVKTAYDKAVSAETTANGKTTMAEAAIASMPKQGSSISVSLPSNGGSYTPSESGWLAISCTSSAQYGYVAVQTSNVKTSFVAAYSGAASDIFLPVTKGVPVVFAYQNMQSITVKLIKCYGVK